jgi:hypothetical protein
MKNPPAISEYTMQIEDKDIVGLPKFRSIPGKLINPSN